MQFYLQAAGRGKRNHGQGIQGVAHRSHRRMHRDVGDRVSSLSCRARAASGRTGPRDLVNAADAAEGLKPFGKYAYGLFAIGLLKRVAVRRLHPTTVDRLYRLRVHGVRVGR